MRKQKLLLGVLLIIALFCHSKLFSQTVIYVDSAASGLKNGQSWKNAYTNLDSAFSHAKNFTATDTIKIAKGTYKPSLVPYESNSSDPRDVAFTISFSGVIVGGYSPGGSILNSHQYQTVLSGDIGIPANPADNAYHVLVLTGNSIEISGLDIVGGNANGTDSLYSLLNIPRFCGGAIYCNNASDNIHDLIIENNAAVMGGGIYNIAFNLTLTNIVFNNNNALFRAGAIYNNTASNSNINNTVFYHCSAQDAGGAILNDNANLYLIDNCTFVSNFAINNTGGAIYNTQSNGNSSISNSIFTNNYYYDSTQLNFIGADIADSANTSNVSYCVVQSFSSGADDYVTLNAGLVDMYHPKGPDNIWATADDGLSITPSSQAFKNGIGTALNFDITNAPRNSNAAFNIGAYETNPCSKLTSHTVYVDSSAKGAENGASWANAFTSLQAAITLARLGCVDTIKVAAGTYTPTNYLSGVTGDPSSAGSIFQLTSNLVIYGGYPTGGATVANPAINKTILTNPFGRILFAGNVSNIVLDGLYIQGANTTTLSWSSFIIDTTTFPNNNGAGMMIYNAGVSMHRCYINNNQSGYNGGGIYLYNSLVKIDSCSFNGNFTYNEGGGIYIDNTVAGSAITNCSFTNNSAGYYGGGLSVAEAYAGLTIQSCLFNANNTIYADGNVIGGGALFSHIGTVLTINKSIFSGNNSFQGGALNFQDNTNNSVFNSFFLNNVASRDGGAVFDQSSLQSNFYNCVFNGNNAASYGGAIYSYLQLYVYFSTFVRNSANNIGGVIDGSATQTIANSLFWLNNIAGDSLDNTSSNLAVVDPGFVNINDLAGPDKILGTSDDGLALKLSSPMINIGFDSYDTTLIKTDITGGPRVLGSYPDLGAYETDFCGLSSFSNHTIYVDSSAVSGNNTGRDWANAFTDLETAFRAFRAGCNVDTIKVAKGSYFPTATPGNTPLVINAGPDATFTVPDNCVLLGGYPTGGGDRDFRKNSTNLGLYRGPDYSSGGHVVTLNNLSNASLDGFTIQGGTAESLASFGGGIFANNSILDVKNCVITHNSESGIYINSCTGHFINCVIDSNTCGDGGAGVYSDGGSIVEFSGCLFSNNVSQGIGAGGILIPGSASIVSSFKNCTFYGNTSSVSGALLSNIVPKITNCVFWNNLATSPGFQNDITAPINNPSDTANISYSLFQSQPSGFSWVHSIYGVSPNFADSSNPRGPDNIWGTADDGLRQTGNSPMINNGINDSVPSYLTTDITGSLRINDGVVDMGPYEYSCGFTNFNSYLIPLGSSVSATNSVNTCGTWQYLVSPSDPTKYIMEIDPNGNSNFNPSQITIDATNSQPQISYNKSKDTLTALAYRMVSINAPAGQYLVNGGVKIRIFYDLVENDTLPGVNHYWFLDSAFDKATVLSGLTYDTLLNSNPITPSSKGTINGVPYVEFDSISNFGTFGYLGFSRLVGLPPQLLSFTANWVASNNSVLLNWTTSNDSTVQIFHIERSSNDTNWVLLDSLAPNVWTGTNSSYSWTDLNPLTGTSYYRIVQVTIDEQTMISDIQKVNSGNLNATFKIQPNPVTTSMAYIQLPAITPVINYKLTDLTGQVIYAGVFYNTNSISIPLNNLTTGIYYLDINNTTQKIEVLR